MPGYCLPAHNPSPPWSVRWPGTVGPCRETNIKLNSRELKHAGKELTPWEIKLWKSWKQNNWSLYGLGSTHTHPFLLPWCHCHLWSFRVEWVCFCWRTYQQLNIKCRNKAKCPGRIARVCFLLESTAAWRHSQHLESGAISTGALKLSRSHGSVLLEETVFLLLNFSQLALSPSALLPVKESYEFSREFSIYTGMWYTGSILHLATVFSPEPLKSFMGIFKSNTPSLSLSIRNFSMYILCTAIPCCREQTYPRVFYKREKKC